MYDGGMKIADPKITIFAELGCLEAQFDQLTRVVRRTSKQVRRFARDATDAEDARQRSADYQSKTGLGGARKRRARRRKSADAK